MRIARRLRFDVMAALLGIVTSVLAVCPCLPPPASALEHSCCPSGSTLALTAASADCCGDHALGATAVAASAIPMPSELGAVPAVVADSSVTSRPFAPVAFVPNPPLVLRI